MDNLIYDLSKNLLLDDIELLNNLIKDEAFTKFSAKPKQSVLKETKISESFLRKSIMKLQAMCFIKVFVFNRRQVLYVTENGQYALQIICERGISK